MLAIRRITSTFVFAFVASCALATPIDFKLESGDTLRIEPIAPGIIRARLSTNGNFDLSLMERYGIVRTNWAPSNFSPNQESAKTRINFEGGALEVNPRDGTMRLLDAKAAVLCEQALPLRSKLSDSDLQAYKKRQADLGEYFKGERRKEGQIQVIGSTQTNNAPQPDQMHEFGLAPATDCFGATFVIRPNERFYGLGTASARRLQLRGHGYRLWTQYRGNFGFDDSKHDWEQTEGPIPLLLSTGGWGVFVNTTWVHYYDVGRYDTNQAFFWGPGGQLDFYFLIGDVPKLLQRYTDITGKPRILPEFAYGLTDVGHITQNQHELLNDTRLYREKGIPCDVIGLEPQWMKKNYDFSHDKNWATPERFYMESWLTGGDHGGTFIGALDRTGYKLSLWLCCDDDMTLEEERQFAIFEGRTNYPAQPDAWFNHLRKFVKQGARAFKMDPEALIEEHPTRKYANGRTDLENHNLTEVLYHKEMMLGYEQFAHERAMTHFCAAYAGVQHWGATTMGDNGGGPKALYWMLNYSMCGHMNTSCDMDVTGEGLHFGFMQPWSQHNNWAYALQPWFLGKDREQMFCDYARLRYSLIPYIYSDAHHGHLTSMPILRPMPLVYPNDPKVENCTYEYMLGDFLLATAFSDKVYLPAGRWIDYWTGTEYQGPREMPCTYPKNRAGGLFIKAGAILPYWPAMNYVGEKPIDTITFEVYPENQSDYNLYEDDGNSLEYLNGAVAKTHLHCDAAQDRLTLTIDPRSGTYRGLPAKRTYEIHIHCPQPKSVTVTGGRDLGYDAQTKTQRIVADDPADRKAPIVIECR